MFAGAAAGVNRSTDGLPLAHRPSATRNRHRRSRRAAADEFNPGASKPERTSCRVAHAEDFIRSTIHGNPGAVRRTSERFRKIRSASERRS
jgi:hypothetical protein